MTKITENYKRTNRYRKENYSVNDITRKGRSILVPHISVHEYILHVPI